MWCDDDDDDDDDDDGTWFDETVGGVSEWYGIR